MLDQIIFMPDTNTDVTIQRNDIGWTNADNSGNTGYGCRCYGNNTRLRFVNNRVHDIAADGFQGVGGSDVLIAGNEIGPVGANPSSSEHSDNIQITGNGANLVIRDNWLHHQGYYRPLGTEPCTRLGSCGNVRPGTLGSRTSMVARPARCATRTTWSKGLEVGLSSAVWGPAARSRSNLTIRRNTFYDNGRAFSGFPGFEWDCDSGSGNTITRNIAVDPDGGFAQAGQASAVVSPNLFGQLTLVTLDADGNCTSANCNPAGRGADRV